TQERHKRRLISGEGESAREAAEMSLDVVSLPRNGHQQVIFELEIELLPAGTRDDLRAVGEALGGFQLAPQPESKFARALAIVDSAGLPGAPADDQSPPEQPAESQPAGETQPAAEALAES